MRVAHRYRSPLYSSSSEAIKRKPTAARLQDILSLVVVGFLTP